MTAQLDIFEENKISLLEEKVKKTEELSEKTYNTSENVRKGIFARLTNLEKSFLQKFLDQQQEIDYLKEAIKGK
jgi:hypothetical protein